jgi:hypothetical protein
MGTRNLSPAVRAKLRKIGRRNGRHIVKKKIGIHGDIALKVLGGKTSVKKRVGIHDPKFDRHYIVKHKLGVHSPNYDPRPALKAALAAKRRLKKGNFSDDPAERARQAALGGAVAVATGQWAAAQPRGVHVRWHIKGSVGKGGVYVEAKPNPSCGLCINEGLI